MKNASPRICFLFFELLPESTPLSINSSHFFSIREFLYFKEHCYRYLCPRERSIRICPDALWTSQIHPRFQSRSKVVFIFHFLLANSRSLFCLLQLKPTDKFKNSFSISIQSPNWLGVSTSRLVGHCSLWPANLHSWLVDRWVNHDPVQIYNIQSKVDSSKYRGEPTLDPLRSGHIQTWSGPLAATFF